MINTDFFSRYPTAPSSTEDTTLNILQFGAVGDGKFLNTSVLQKAIDTCSRKGGGKLVVPKGDFLTGTLYLKSNVHLYLEEGGVILGSPFKKDYSMQTLVHADGQKNIMISGKGMINGNAQVNSTGEFRDTGNNDNRPPLFTLDLCSE